MQLDFNNNFFFTRTAPQKLKINRATKEKNNKIKKSAKSAE